MSDKTFFDFILLTFHENAGVPAYAGTPVVILSQYSYTPILSYIAENPKSQTIQRQSMVLSEAKKSSLKGTVTDENGNPISGVSLRMDEDDNYELPETDEEGCYELMEAFSSGYSYGNRG